MGKNGKVKIEGAEVIAGDNQPYRDPLEHWRPDFGDAPSNNNIDKILEIPDIEDMAGVLARGNFKNDRQRIAAVRLAYKNRKFHDENHQEMLRDYIASGLGIGAVGKVMQTFIGTNLLAPDMFRASLGMPKSKNKDKGEEVHRGSDFRSEGRERELADRRT